VSREQRGRHARTDRPARLVAVGTGLNRVQAFAQPDHDAVEAAI
jgi:hypothetical protein